MGSLLPQHLVPLDKVALPCLSVGEGNEKGCYGYPIYHLGGS
jgi:hypothetical protein